MAICVIIVNVSDYSSDRDVIFVGVWVSMCTILVIWTVAFLGAYYINYEILMVACSSWFMFILFWIIVDLGCTTPSRCQEGLWLVNNFHRLESGSGFSGPDYYYHSDHEQPSDKPPKKINDYTPRQQFSTQKSFGLKFYLPWDSNIGAITYLGSFVITLGIFILSFLMLYNYGSYLKCKTMLESTQCQISNKCLK
ncbi:uncharacterized protein LOC126902856 isoform X2 [Daktulosphaira vitifoliae]|nr:uncharacterized protein LOC126902856 isoform X2 [Daktulosphaira vitifoliae]